MEETKQLTDLIKKDRIVEAVRLLDNMLKKNFIFGEHVLVTSGVQSRMTWFLSALTNCIVQLRSDQDVNKLLLISDVIEHMCQQCDVHENSIREKISKMYLQMSCNLVKMQKCDTAYKFSVYAICTSPDYTLDEYWKRCLMTRVSTSGRNDMTEELKKPVTSFLKSSTFSNWVSIPKLLLLELEWCKRYRRNLPWFDEKYIKSILKDILTYPLDVNDRVRVHFHLAELIFCNPQISSDDPLECINKAFGILECEQSLEKNLLLIRGYLLQYSIILRRLAKPDAISLNPEIYEMTPVIQGRKDAHELKKMTSSIVEFQPALNYLEKAYKVWKSELCSAYYNADERIKKDILDITKEITALSLLNGMILQALELTLWHFQNMKKMQQFSLIVLLLCFLELPRALEQFIADYESKVQIETEIEKDTLEIIRIFFTFQRENADNLEEVIKYFCEIDETGNDNVEKRRMLCYFHYATYYASSHCRNEKHLIILRRYCSYIASITTAHRYINSVVAYFLKNTTEYDYIDDDVKLDLFLLMLLNREATAACLHAGLLRYRCAYQTEAFSLALRIRSPYWLCHMLGLMFEEEVKLTDHPALQTFENIAHSLFDYKPCCPVDSNLISFITPRRKTKSDMFYFFLENYHSKNAKCQCFVCKNIPFRIEMLHLAAQQAIITDEPKLTEILLSLIEKITQLRKAILNEVKMVLEGDFSTLISKIDMNEELIYSTLLNLQYTLLFSLIEGNFDDDLIEQSLNQLPNLSRMPLFYELSFSQLRFSLSLNDGMVATMSESFPQLNDDEDNKKSRKKKNKQKSQFQIMETISNQLQLYGHMLYYPWYQKAHEALAICHVKQDDHTDAAHHIGEALLSSVRHSILVDQRRLPNSALPIETFPVRFDDKEDMLKCTEHLPESWTIVTLYMTSVEAGSELYVVRMSSRCQPFVVNLGNVLDQFSALNEFNSIAEKNKESMKLTNRKRFWETRFELNNAIENWLDELEEKWFKEWKVLFQHKADLDVMNMVNDLHEHCNLPLHIVEIVVDGYLNLKEEEFTTLLGHLVAKKYTQTIRKMLKQKFPSPVNDGGENGPVILILGREFSGLPLHAIRSLRHLPVTRCPSIHFLCHLFSQWNNSASVMKQKSFYVLNPSNDLQLTQQRFENFFKSLEGWEGCIGRHPTSEEIQCAFKKDLFIYVGHGGGSRYLKNAETRFSTCNATVLLMGCSSGRLLYGRRYEQVGPVAYYQMAKSPNVVAALWNITDKDVDRFLDALLRIWLRFESPTKPDIIPATPLEAMQTRDLLIALNHARQFCKLKFLTGAAIVSYGLPVSSST
ncbi:Separin [Trichinella nelsoni]|uniref:separase n=1 Tax=Trichinella nelsoni TaxID=6336 RepID=A0A0V0SKX7_9BILA|nr:Separin [Trichinella nelsoni]